MSYLSTVYDPFSFFRRPPFERAKRIGEPRIFRGGQERCVYKLNDDETYIQDRDISSEFYINIYLEPISTEGCVPETYYWDFSSVGVTSLFDHSEWVSSNDSKSIYSECIQAKITDSIFERVISASTERSGARLLMFEIESRFKYAKFSEVNSILVEADFQRLSVRAIVALVRSTNRARGLLPAWLSAYHKAQSELVSRGEDVEELFIGLNI